MEIKIDNKSIPLKERFNLILGNFEENQIEQEQANLEFKKFNDFSRIRLNRFLEYFKLINPPIDKFDKLNNLIGYLELFHELSVRNISLIESYADILSSLFSLINFNLKFNKKKSLEKELELARLKEKSTILSEKTSLLNNLNEQIEKNRQELEYLEEDYFKVKNKKKQIQERISNLKETKKKLNQKRKEKFSEINTITRNMEDPKTKSKIPEVSGLSNAERIKKLRKEAKEIHYRIRKINSEIDEAKNKLDSIQPKFKSYKKDYNALKSTIERQENQIEQNKKEIEKITQTYKENSTQKLKMDQLSNIRNYKIIKKDLKNTEKKIEMILNENQFIEEKKIQEFGLIIDKLSDFQKNIIENGENLMFDIMEDKVISIVEDLRDFELILTSVGDIMNKFLLQINLQIDLFLAIDFENKEFFIQSNFLRKEKENLDFENLTTPEKVYVAISFFIATHIVINNSKIIFSNFFLNDKFNKRGSLFRTIRKIIPLLKDKEIFEEIEITFLISNLKMKRPIENINIIKL